MRITTNQGPSAHNQTSNDHSLDRNQEARQPSVKDVVEADGLVDNIPSDVVNTATDHETTHNSEKTERLVQ